MEEIVTYLKVVATAVLLAVLAAAVAFISYGVISLAVENPLFALWLFS